MAEGPEFISPSRLVVLCIVGKNDQCLDAGSENETTGNGEEITFTQVPRLISFMGTLFENKSDIKRDRVLSPRNAILVDRRSIARSRQPT
jgi:hypothetical protein